jgi:hypothetical protein
VIRTIAPDLEPQVVGYIAADMKRYGPGENDTIAPKKKGGHVAGERKIEIENLKMLRLLGYAARTVFEFAGFGSS